MKFLLFVFLFFAGISAFASSIQPSSIQPRSLAYVCHRISAEIEKFQCIAAGTNVYLDELALGACDTFTTNSGTINCIEAIADRVYTKEEVNLCHNIRFEKNTIKCFQQVGSSEEDKTCKSESNYKSDFLQLRRMSKRALRAYNNGNDERVGKILRRMQKTQDLNK